MKDWVFRLGFSLTAFYLFEMHAITEPQKGITIRGKRWEREQQFEGRNLPTFRTKSGYVKQKLYEDGVHLDEKATKTLAEQIFNKVNRIPKNFFD